jgi:hypothetical protein
VTTASDFRTAQVQLSLFTPGMQFRAAKILTFLLAEYGERFDGVPMSLPPLGDVPSPGPQWIIPSPPQLILQSSDGSLKLQASAERLDVFRGGESLTEEEMASELGWATELGLKYLHRSQSKAGRVACVLHRYADDANAARTLARHFCKPRWIDTALNRPGDFELHAHKRFRLDDLFEINSWIRCKTAFRVAKRMETERSSEHDVIFVEQDLNSLADQMQEREIQEEEIRRFFALAPVEMRHILDLYFPND